jgi:hypothetical protein
MRAPINEFPWPIGFRLVGFFIAFFAQFRLKYHIDRDKGVQIEDMSELHRQAFHRGKFLRSAVWGCWLHRLVRRQPHLRP